MSLIPGILGKKIGMTTVFDGEGNAVPVTVVQAGPCNVLATRDVEKNGYKSVVLTFDERKEKQVNKPLLSQFKKIGINPTYYMKEIRLKDDAKLDEVKLGQKIIVTEVFKDGDYVDVTGNTKGRGFTGVMKRHNFHGAACKTRGTHEYRRHGGSIGMHTWPARVFKNKKMPGHYGDERVTIQNLRIVKILAEDNVMMIRGAVPGPNKGYLIIKPAVRTRSIHASQPQQEHKPKAPAKPAAAAKPAPAAKPKA